MRIAHERKRVPAQARYPRLEKIGETLIDMNYYGDGWMQIEGSSPEGADIVQSCRHNLEFLQDIFHS